MPTPGGLRHWSDQSGYFDSSNAFAPTLVIARAAASAIEPMALRKSMSNSHADDGRRVFEAAGERNVRRHGSARLVSRFRRSYHHAARTFTNVGTKGTLATLWF